MTLSRDFFNDFWGYPTKDDWRWTQTFNLMGDTPSAITRVLSSEIKKHDDKAEVVIVLPGFKRKEISIEIDDRVLKIEAKRTSDSLAYSDSWRLHSVYNVEAITSKLEDGILYINIPREKESKTESKRVIPIK